MSSCVQLDIDPDIRCASTPPSSFYRDPAVFEWMREHVFARSWQMVIGAEQVSAPQQAAPFAFLEHCVDEPLLLTRTAEDELHCVSNVCTHRGAIIVDGPCRAAHLRCPYHGRQFRLDGSFDRMPGFEETKGFPTERDDLKRLPLERWGPFVFTALDPAWSFDDAFREIRTRVDWLRLERCVFDPARSRDYLVEANWALYCDNYLEGFHIPFVHQGLAPMIDWGAYRTELFRYANVQVGVSQGGEFVLDPPESSPDHGQPIAGYYFWVFPNMMFNVYPWGISVNIVRPLTVDRTKISYLTYVLDETKLDRGAGNALDRVEREDEVVVESVQRGVRSRLYDRGRYSPNHERGVHHFHRLLAEFTNGVT